MFSRAVRRELVLFDWDVICAVVDALRAATLAAFAALRVLIWAV